ncbi:MAG: flagellar biosynthetic protein FliR [Firmicutes bacterium]|nr:flagellar biosynthetic protein FliR [Bacillota bacterium]
MPPTLAHPSLLPFALGKIVVWVLVLTRITGLVAALPGLGQERLPLMPRVALGLMLAVILAPVVPPPSEIPTGIWHMAGYMVTEMAAGLLMGLFVGWIVEAVGFAGQLMDTQMGFAFAQFLDPATARPASVSGVMLMQLTILFIFVSGLHHQMILALVESYRLVPMGAGLPGNPLQIVSTVGQLLGKGLQLAFPVLFTLFLIDALQGISARFMPQLQLMQLAFPLKIGVGLAILGVVLRELFSWLMPLFQAAPREALRFLR